MPHHAQPVIRHIPTGYYPFGPSGIDMSPRNPAAGEFVIVKAEVDGFEVGDVYAEVRLNGTTVRTVKGRKITNYHVERDDLLPHEGSVPERAEYCLFELGRFAAGDVVQYSIRAFGSEGVCGPYEFTVAKDYACSDDATLSLIGGRLVAQFGPIGQYLPRVEFSFDGGCLRMVHSLGRECMETQESEARVSITDPDTCARLEIESSPFRFVLTAADGKVLIDSSLHEPHFKFRAASHNEPLRFTLCLGSSAAHYYGFGERFDSLDQNGLDPDVCVVNQYLRQGARTYIPMPFFVTEAGYGMHIATDRYVRFGLSPRLPGTMHIEAQVDPKQPVLESVVLFGQPADIVRTYSKRTGETVLPPKWAFGPWISGNAWNTQREVEEQLLRCDELGLPATVIVIEAWADEATFYIWNDAQHLPEPGEHAFVLDEFTFPKDGKWPDPKAFADRVHANGMKLVLWQIPVLKRLMSHEPRCKQHERDEEYAISQGYVVRHADGTPYRIPVGWFAGSLLLDFTNPAAKSWWFSKRRYLMDDIGVDGFKTDGGEFILDEKVTFQDGQDGATMRNRYAMMYIDAYRDFVGPDRITFSRAGFVGAQSSPLYWAGDQVSSFKEFRAVVTAGLSIGLSGVPFWGFDIAGFSGDIPTAELYIRGLQTATFSPVMQFHSESRGAENWDRSPWNMAARTEDERIIPIYRTYANLRMNLLPYIYNEAINSAERGEPLMRALMIDFPSDPASFVIDDEYMFGRDLLVAPILKEHARERVVHFPPGTWLNFWTLEEIAAGPCTMSSYPSDIHMIPVFVREGAIIPINLGDNMYLGDSTGVRGMGHKNLSFLITGKPTQEWVFADDDGTNIVFTPYEDGLCVRANTVGAVRDVSLLILGTDCGNQACGRRTVWATGGVEAEVIRLNTEDLMRGFRYCYRTNEN
jgi:alpha-glucosidase (family GH31 glycosyl hydrolase)